MKLTPFVLFLFIASFCYSQNTSKIDSLENIIANTTNDSILMHTYNKLRRATYYTDQKKAKEYTLLFLEKAQQRKDSLHIAFANYYLGNNFVLQSDFENAFKYYFKSANYFEKTKDSARLSSILNGIGAAYENNGNDSLSLKYFKQSQHISKSLGDLRRSAIALNNIGNIYKNRGDLNKAREYMEQAVSQINTTGQLDYIFTQTLNLASTYTDLKEFKKSTALYNSMLQKMDTLQDKLNYSRMLKGLGNTYLAKGDNKLALKHLKHAYNKFSSSGFFDDSYDMMPDLINAFEVNKQYASGLKLFNEYNTIKDSIFNAEKDKNLTEALTKYEAEKKDAQLKVLTLETEKAEQQKRMYLYLALAGLLLAGFIGFFLYKNRKKNITLAKQKNMLQDALDEKNVLLKEVHHRVKNSFQIVSSLLYLQSENVEDKQAKIAIKEAENRVRSMVLIHQKLYNKDELVGINTKEYFNDLVKDIFESHQFKKKPIAYELDVESHVLDIETITPLGLILNELIINTLKHAFKEVNEKSKLIVNFAKENDELILKVIDNGNGFEGEIKSTSFGITLMKALSKKLKASLNYQSKIGKGTQAILNIKKFTILS